MTSLLPDNLKSMVKGGLRDARHVARRLGEAARSSANSPVLPPGSGRLIVRIVDLSDETLTRMEAIAQDLLARRPGAATMPAAAPVPVSVPATPLPLERYFALTGPEGRALFQANVRAVIGQIMASKGASGFELSEASLDAAHAAILSDVPAALRAGGPARTLSRDEICHGAAVLAQALARTLVFTAPSMLADEQRRTEQSPVIFAAAAFALASAVVTHTRDINADEDIVLAVSSAIDSRYARIRTALSPGRGTLELAKIFSGLIVHLP